MDNPVDQYLDEVMKYARLRPTDEERVRAELKDHLQLLIANVKTSQEILPMLNEKFGEPRDIGKSIGGTGSWLGAYLKRKRRKWAIQCGVAVVLGLAVRYSVAQPFYCSGSGAAPQIPLGSHVLVYKLARSFSPGDVIVYRITDGSYLLGIVKNADSSNSLLVSHNGQPDQTMAMERVVGRVFLNTR